MQPVQLHDQAWQLAVVIRHLPRGVHAFRKLSPYFAITWFGAGLVFGWFWTEHRQAPEALLLPALVVYIAAAVTKGIVERGVLAGVHIVHVLATGLFAGLIALPLETAAASMRWVTPRPRAQPDARPRQGRVDSGGGSADLALQWVAVGLVFYGVYKILDHIGLGVVVQTILLFALMPVLPKLIAWLLGLVG